VDDQRKRQSGPTRGTRCIGTTCELAIGGSSSTVAVAPTQKQRHATPLQATAPRRMQRIAVARVPIRRETGSRLGRLNRRRLIGVEPQEGSPSRHARRRRPGRCGRIAVCESSGIARTSSRSRRRGRSSPPWLPARGSRSTRCALLPTLRQPPSNCSRGSWTTSIGPESGSQSRRRTATGADSQEPGRPPR